MNIIIVGCGNVGSTLTRQLTLEDHNITVIDPDADAVAQITDACDVMGVVDTGVSYNVLTEAGVSDADLLVAVTDSDEMNLLCCLLAKKAGDCKTIARVRNPVYKQEVGFIKEELGLTGVINPEEAAAREAARLLQFPSAKKIENFARGTAELVTLVLQEDSLFVGKSLKNIQAQLDSHVLVTLVMREGKAIIPNGDFVPLAHDELSLIGTPKRMAELFRKLKLPIAGVRSTIIVGGGQVAYYLAQQLVHLGIRLTIFEKDKKRAMELSQLLPEAIIINADGSNRDMLMEEGLAAAESFVTLTGIDEENIMLSLFAKKVSKAKLITRIEHTNYGEIVDQLDIGSILYPKNITAERIEQYVRRLNNSIESGGIETLYRLNEDKAEVLEFLVGADDPVVGKPLMELPLKDNVLIATIIHKGETTTANGRSVIREGDSVIVVTTHLGFDGIEDILQ